MSQVASTSLATSTPAHADARGGGAPPRAGRREWLALAVLMLPVLLVSIDNTVLSFALPQISQDLGPSATQLLWIVDIYALLLAGLLVTMGTLGDRVGRRLLLLVGAAGFGLVSVYAAFATDAGQLIVARALLGVFGATLMPSTLALLRSTFLDAGQRRLAIAVWAAAFSGGSALGPVVGGWLLEHFWWGSVFLINVPVLAVLLVTAPLLLRESRGTRAGRFDLVSVALSILAMLPLVFGIKTIVHDGVTGVGIGALAVAIASGVLFVRRQLRRDEPLLDVRLFTRGVFTASVLANLLAVFALAGLVFYVSQYLQLVLGLEPMDAGLRLVPGALAAIAMGLLAVVLARHAPLYVLVPAGLLLSAAGYALATTLTSTSEATIVVVFALVGAGAGLAETLTNDAILASVPTERAGAASAISETAYELGAATGVAVLGSVLSATYRGALDLPAGLSAEQATTATETLGGAVAVAGEVPFGEAVLDAAREAFSRGVDLTSAIGAVILVGAAIVTAILLRRATRTGGRAVAGAR
ncbi:major facilitator superfamily MFS_1 [Beutenbergia cavernae DSM 12333]|uniref:Major facilitator superfamily MFS_1 n=1 Tax=Beutenbergia cavernae (strain ATCC BAA-8 / DSM 12333 / CCUG 43141 / JCM 11478 / NBRC 16432 / NCIMB 13614 / HKI 0122) TaxID=471853 RepID=C5C223_BEUC1|nr:MFS transporter [Beutenbergia cavernae]ACQ81648.1 major facilitator superfamily MFS_1 [Beutenbergia cavernae DSM 12333]